MGYNWMKAWLCLHRSVIGSPVVCKIKEGRAIRVMEPQRFGQVWSYMQSWNFPTFCWFQFLKHNGFFAFQPSGETFLPQSPKEELTPLWSPRPRPDKHSLAICGSATYHTFSLGAAQRFFQKNPWRKKREQHIHGQCVPLKRGAGLPGVMLRLPAKLHTAESLLLQPWHDFLLNYVISANPSQLPPRNIPHTQRSLSWLNDITASSSVLDRRQITSSRSTSLPCPKQCQVAWHRKSRVPAGRNIKKQMKGIKGRTITSSNSHCYLRERALMKDPHHQPFLASSPINWGPLKMSHGPQNDTVLYATVNPFCYWVLHCAFSGINRKVLGL